MKLSLKLPARFAPRQPRAAVAIDATLLLPDDQAVPVSIRNISADGFMGEAAAEIEPGTAIGVALPGCRIVPARVRWSSAGELGAQFRTPLDIDQLETDGKTRSLFASRIRQGPL